MSEKNREKMKIVSLFTGAGGLDLGFEKAGFETIWANEFDNKIWETFEFNFPNAKLDRRSITDVEASEVPAADGMIGGPPCQSWSLAGSGRGINDKRGQLFYDYIRLIKTKQPKFFLVENVRGILSPKHATAWNGFLEEFARCGYKISWKLVNANDYDVPEDRWRVIIVGFREDLGKKFVFPEKISRKPTLREAIGDLPEPKPALAKNHANKPRDLNFANNEYLTGGFSPIYMSRNRVRGWDEPSFTIQAGGRQSPIHPSAPKMVKVETNKQIFAKNHEDEYRRLSVREAARIQTFPDEYIFKYNFVADGYKMIGNAVPVNLAYSIARAIRDQLV